MRSDWEGVHVRCSGMGDEEDIARIPRRRDPCWGWPTAGPRRERDWMALVIAEEQSEKASRGVFLAARIETEMPRSSW